MIRKQQLRERASDFVVSFEDVTLAVILLATLIAGGQELWRMWTERSVALTDLLLLFIYLEVISMVRVYWQLGKLPVSMPIFIAMIALARHLIIGDGGEHAARVIAEAGAVLVLALAVLVVRYGHSRYASEDEGEEAAAGPSPEVKPMEGDSGGSLSTPEPGAPRGSDKRRARRAQR